MKAQQAKKPWAVAVGNRIKQARQMAGMQTQASLLQSIAQWSTSRLGNYEAGISLPSPEDVLLLAQATQSSPCWIMFGIGPIRASARDVQAIRHQNLHYFNDTIANKPTQMRAWLAKLGISRKKLHEFLDNPFATIADRMARRCEAFFKKPSNWMDEQHVESDPLCASFPADIRELMMIYSEMDNKDRQRLLSIARAFDTQSE